MYVDNKFEINQYKYDCAIFDVLIKGKYRFEAFNRHVLMKNCLINMDYHLHNSSTLRIR